MKVKNGLYALLLCLVFITAAACSPAAGPDDDRREFQALGNKPYHSPSGAYDDDRGFKNDFQLADLNPNLVTGTNDLYNLDADADNIAGIAAAVPGVDRANVNINGGTAHVTLDVDRSFDVTAVRSAVLQRVKQKMPRYNIDVDVIPGV